MAKKKYSKKYNNTVNIFWTGGGLDAIGSINMESPLGVAGPKVDAAFSTMGPIKGTKLQPVAVKGPGLNAKFNNFLAGKGISGNQIVDLGNSTEALFSIIANMMDKSKSDTDLIDQIGLNNTYAGGGPLGWAQMGTDIATSIVDDVQKSKGRDVSHIIDAIKKGGNIQVASGNYDNIMAQRGMMGEYNHVTKRDLGHKNFGQVLLSSSGEAAQGFAKGFSSTGNVWGGIAQGVVQGVGDALSAVIGNANNKRKARYINRESDRSNIRKDYTFDLALANTKKQQHLNAMSNVVAANGGPLNMKYTGVMSPFGNRFDLGGNMDTTFTNGVTIIGNGGTHEESPLEGVPMGIAPDGKPNLVEEGEVIWNDYVFSDRLKVPKAIRKQYKLRGNKELTFADAAKQMQKESEERPNDPISKRGLQDSMMKLMSIQEIVRQEKEGNQFSVGGHLFDTGSKLNTYRNFTALPKDTDFYDQDYLAFWDWMNANRTDQKAIDWLNRINAGEFGTVGGNTFNFDDILRLAKDYKKGPVHNAFYEASRAFAKEDPIIKRTPSLNLGIVPFKDEKVQFKGDKSDESAPPFIPRKPLLDNPHWLRYASVLGPGIGLLQNLLSKPDYSRADEIINASRNIDPVEFDPIGDYLQYTPLDRNYYINKALADNAATRRSFENLSGGNRALAAAGILGADYNTIEGLGKLARQAEEYNLEQRKAVKEFNRGTNQFNAQGKFEADRANQQMRLAGLDALIKATAMKEDIDARRSASISANLGKLFDNLGAVGTDITNRRDRNMLIENGALYAPFVEYIDEKLAEKDSKEEQSVTGAKGGKLNKKYKKK